MAKNRLFFILIPLLALAITSPIFILNSLTTKQSIVEAKKEKILSCLGTNKTGYIELPGIKACIDRTLVGDENVKDAVESNEAFRLAQEVNPLTFTFCHKNMHDLAHKVPSSEVLNVLKMTDWNTCEWGFVHGLLEDAAVGKMEKYFSPIIDICNGWKDYRGRIECAHSVGHGAWNSSHDVKRSIEICQNFKAYEQKQMCSYGLFMQIFWATSGLPTSKFDTNPKVVLETCANLRLETRKLCIESSAMTYRLYYNKKTIKIRDFLSLSMNEEKRLPQDILDKITFYSKSAKKICNIFEERDKEICAKVVWQTGVDIDGPALTRSDVTEAICKAYPEYYGECLALAKRTKNYWASRNVYSY